MDIENLNEWLINYIKTRRNDLLSKQGRHSAQEKEIQKLLTEYASFAGQDIEVLNEATDKNKYYKLGEIV